jgi:hypothetical protein
MFAARNPMSTKPQNSALDRICGRSDGFNKHECRAKAVSHTEFARRIVYRMLKPGTGQPIDAPSRITVAFCAVAGEDVQVQE